MNERQMDILFREIKDNIIAISRSRIFVFAVLLLIMAGVLVVRLFDLQIIKGDEYLDNFNLKIKKEQVISNTRGAIYDCDGKVLAYNEVVYSIVIEDSGTYEDLDEKNEVLNSQLLELFSIIESNGDSVVSDFKVTIDKNGQYSYMVSGTEKLRFLADVFGKPYIEDLDETEQNMSADELMSYFCSEDKYNISADLSKDDTLKLVTVRSGLSLNNYQKYITTTVAENISEKTKASVLESIEKYEGVSIKESTIRKYNSSPYMSHIIGYVGNISESELKDYENVDEKYDYNYIVGKTGIEKYMETELQGKNGYRSFYVDNLGKVLETDEEILPESGNDVYLSVSSDYQETIYKVLEEHLAGILLSKLVRTSAYETRKINTSDDLVVSIDEVYVQFINNNLIDTNHFTDEYASATEKQVYSLWEERYNKVIGNICQELRNDSSKPIIEYDQEYQEYQYDIVNYLSEEGILDNEVVEQAYTPFSDFEAGSISLREYLTSCIVDEHIVVSELLDDETYANAEEIYVILTEYIEKNIKHDSDFKKLIYEYLILDKVVTGRQLCIILYDQGVLAMNNTLYNRLHSGSIAPYDFVYDRINNLELTPAMIALDPCSASVVLTDVKTGKVKAMVSYPSYDNNKLTNHIDSEYYNKLINDQSLPLYNRATQQKTAPGSTFKMVSAVAGIEENVITKETAILDEGVFTKVESNNKCWIYPENHGWLNVTSAIRHSCNSYFYEVGYRLGLTGEDEESFNDSYGISRLEKYASQFGFDEVSGVEISESEPHIATKYPITAAIGQSDNNFTVSQLSRYVTAIANKGSLYKLSLLDSVKTSEGNILQYFAPELTRSLEFSNESWSVIRQGMVDMAASSAVLSTMGVKVAGKTGTAQEATNRADHALFVGYAPYDDPEVSISVRIPYGYYSSNAVEVARDVFNYYFKLSTKEELVTGKAITPGTEVIQD